MRFVTLRLVLCTRHRHNYYNINLYNIYTATHNVKVASFSGLTSFLCRIQYRKIVHGKNPQVENYLDGNVFAELDYQPVLRMREGERYALLATLSAHSILDEGDLFVHNNN